jgi:transposase
VVNPARIKGYAQARMQRNKTDKLDSAIIASFCATQHPTAWQPLTTEQRRLRALVRHRDDLLQTRLQQQNRLRDSTDTLVRQSLQTVLDAVETQIAAVEQQISAHLAAHAELRSNLQLLTAIVGIGAVTAAKLLAEIATIDQYESAKAAAADTGVTPSHYESGTSVRRRAHMSKLGNANLRAALYWPAITAMRRCPAFKVFAKRLAARGKPKKVIIGAVMRKLVHIIYGVLKHKTPYDPAKVLGPSATAT